jgi:hypothetical protein
MTPAARSVHLFAFISCCLASPWTWTALKQSGGTA